ncbi:putative phytosulfokine 4 [Arabidopsis thaliana]|uniref:Putative phytosulfokines 4 n=4 Tax=Arabidopsis TaxID=3701 RepID=PSK4_ARATH|nr:phytosulfokine 6 precursor [Arabidopsis thaliana]Q9SZG4.1 RecName: Full=Putative phytosulfokines 4; Short=AtPSK4; Contains: RecName: Full=Phytosulfokine-alpha-like; Short=PSK-alpha-like; Short=Phytosulfokine-a-like; Contains: RecName: Full=Phytosulfokine-beta; Short=PSK-beta; Short=Phytosulfokine-b; Flags: Precursor [Arabidopsis thaliana]KAG7618790.1 Phytosulfokine [Arabidopsis thaliana x Arabidopsis arenosa]KAG7623260.1 Phytosulfokine [Arabidopsis suecica]AEE86831.1 phytosulfokine 6 precurs|eukprot:NP_195486.1 phytosulfokine 6 precursor [Arabidopsis thaliana]
MANLSTLITIALLLCATMLTCSARPEPAYFASFTTSPADTLSLEMIESKLHEVAGESCDKEDDEDCLVRRTLTAHLDYIYTHKNNHH